MKNDTAAAIRNALTNILRRHSMDGITVKWICLEAGVSKQTFYNYDYGVGEVLEAICRDICAEAAGEGKAGEDGGTICRKILGAVCRHRDVLIHLYRSGRREEVGALLRYRLDDEEREKEYPMPVIQVRAPGGGPVLPATGSCGVVLFRAGGILSAGAGWALLRRRRRRENPGD